MDEVHRLKEILDVEQGFDPFIRGGSHEETANKNPCGLAVPDTPHHLVDIGEGCGREVACRKKEVWAGCCEGCYSEGEYFQQPYHALEEEIFLFRRYVVDNEGSWCAASLRGILTRPQCCDASSFGL